MSRINSNIASLTARRILATNNAGLDKSLERLSTGLAVNRGSDDPARLIAGEKIRGEVAGLQNAIANAERASQIVNIAEGGLAEVNNLLVEIQALTGQNASDAGLSQEEKEANQLQIDQILQTIDRISTVTNFQGSKLLNGRLDFRVSDVSGNVSDFRINSAKFNEGSTTDVSVVVTQSAQHASLFLDLGQASVNTGADDGASRLTFELAGVDGTREFSFASGTAIAAVAAGINEFTDSLGVSATVTGNVVNIQSTKLGDTNYVSVEFKDVEATQVGNITSAAALNEDVGDGGALAFTAATAALRHEGQDVGATINGLTANAKGGTAGVSTDLVDLEVDLTDAGAQAVGAFTAFTITGGGARFQLGSTVSLDSQVRLGVPNVAARNLGNETDGFLDSLAGGQTNNIVDGDLDQAQRVVSAAIDQVSSLRGRLGAFQKFTVGSTINALNIALENTSAAVSAIRDADFAKETADLTRNQVLVQASSRALQIANQRPENILLLL